MKENGKGRVYQPPGRKVWMLAYHVGPADARRLVRESAKTRDEAEARRALDRKLRDSANAEDGLTAGVEEPKHRRVTVHTLFDDLKAEYERRQTKGFDREESRLRDDGPLRQTFGNRKAAAIERRDVAAYVEARRAAGMKNATINREVEQLKAAFRLGVESGRVLRMPKFPKALKEKNARQGFFETGDYLKVAAVAPQPLADMLRFSFATGWRRGMLIALKWGDVDLLGGLVTLPDSKNDDPQTIPLDEDLRAIIERQWMRREYRTAFGTIGIAEHVFNFNGRKMSTTTYNRHFRKAAKAAGVIGRIPHDLRRTAARNMVKAGVPESIAMTITGHRTSSMFRRYAITDDTDRLKALKAAREYAVARAAVGQNVAPFRSPSPDPPTDTPQTHIPTFSDTHALKGPYLLGDLVGTPGFEPGTP